VADVRPYPFDLLSQGQQEVPYLNSERGDWILIADQIVGHTPADIMCGRTGEGVCLQLLASRGEYSGILSGPMDSTQHSPELLAQKK
jgi:hypothetical protein